MIITANTLTSIRKQNKGTDASNLYDEEVREGEGREVLVSRRSMHYIALLFNFITMIKNLHSSFHKRFFKDFIEDSSFFSFYEDF